VFTQSEASKHKYEDKTMADRARGTVKWFDEDKGYGFIAREDESEEDVFLHFSELNQQGFKTVEEGDELEFEVEMGPKGPKATNVDKL
jgi:CspA family cold shock protein